MLYQIIIQTEEQDAYVVIIEEDKIKNTYNTIKMIIGVFIKLI